MSRGCGEKYIWNRRERRCVLRRGKTEDIPVDIMKRIVDQLTAAADYNMVLGLKHREMKFSYVDIEGKEDCLQNIVVNKISKLLKEKILGNYAM